MAEDGRPRAGWRAGAAVTAAGAAAGLAVEFHVLGWTSTARPALPATVSGNTLVVATQKPGGYDADHVSAHSLGDGRRL
ncbi:hypothetical protein S1361_26640 [Streptomyces cyanogenus]|uniref:Uncharacterized protein n=1 Tax=Streptomyces cyanogenus TaxID=80860 RepID=A0ABX7TVZ1_STRCY|nr:hypothetical protein S1361_26640 [Streptomyces cyanogenus]